MASTFCLPENVKIVTGTSPVTTNGEVTGDYINMKNAHRVFVVFHLTQAVGHATVCSVMKATAVAPTGDTAITATVPCWENEDTATNDTLVRQTDAASITLAADVKNKIVVMQIDPEKLGATYDCIAGKTTASSQATNFVSVMYYIQERYQQATPPSAVID